jgi:tetratricopeptide (TPR) repeat protein
MKKIFYLLLLIISMLWSIDIDVDFLENSVRKNPRDIDNRILLSKYYLQNREYQTAQYYLNEILKLQPANKIARRLQKETLEGLNLQKYLPDVNLQDPYEIEEKLNIFLKEKKYKLFNTTYSSLEKLHIPLTLQTYLMAAEHYLDANNITMANKILAATKGLSESYPLLAIKTYLAAKKGNLPVARENLQKLETEDPTNHLIPKIVTAIKAHEYTMTNKLAKTITKQNSIQKLQEYVYLLNKQDKKEEAINAVKSFLKHYPNNFDAKLLLVKLYYWKGDIDTAFHKIYSFRKRNKETKKLYANILYERGDYTHALVYLPESIKNEKNEHEQYNLKKRLAFAYLYTGKESKAEKIFQQLLKENPNDKEILQLKENREKQNILNKAINYHKQHDFIKALTYYKDYFSQTNDPKIAKEIAEIYYFTNKQYNEALPYFQTYLHKFPNDSLIQFHYASALEKLKQYKKAANEYAKITSCKNPELCYLARYHEGYSLMQTQNESDWIKARKILEKLSTNLAMTHLGQYADLKKFSASLLKTVRGEIQKPTYYKDIVLTEGAKKHLNPKSVFSNVYIKSTTKPSLEELLDLAKTKKTTKPSAHFQIDYVRDSHVRYTNYQLMVQNLITANGIRYSVSAQKYLFHFIKQYEKKGKGFFLHMKRGNLQVSLGVKELGDFNLLVPKLSWSTNYGVHNFYFDAYYQNGAFANYRKCMILNKTDVLHVGLYDRILMDNLDFAEFSLSLNAFEDGNTNIYTTLTYPFYSFNFWGLNHKLIFNENIDFNSKTKVCSQPSSLYDSTYLIYNPKMTFNQGSMEIKLGKGYSFNNQEYISSYMIKGDYRVNNIASLELNCERVQSSFTSDDIDYCTFNIIQEW